jgi:hypothetical protein
VVVYNFSVLGCVLNGDRRRFLKGGSVTSDNLGWRRHGGHDKGVVKVLAGEEGGRWRET